MTQPKTNVAGEMRVWQFLGMLIFVIPATMQAVGTLYVQPWAVALEQSGTPVDWRAALQREFEGMCLFIGLSAAAAVIAWSLIRLLRYAKFRRQAVQREQEFLLQLKTQIQK